MAVFGRRRRGREVCGPRGEFDPVRKQQAEILPECGEMLKAARDYVGEHADVCSAL